MTKDDDFRFFGAVSANFFNSLAALWCGYDLRNIIFQLIIKKSILGTRCEIDITWMPKNFTEVNIDFGNALVPSGIESLPDNNDRWQQMALIQYQGNSR